MELIFIVSIKNEEEKKKVHKVKMAFDTNGAIITYKLNIETPYNLLAN